MARIEGAVVVRRPVAEVFDFVADECNEPRYNPRMVRVEQITPGPIGIGTRFHAEARTLGRRPAPMTIEYTGFEPGRQLASSIRSAAMDVSGSLTFTSVPAGTRLSWSWDFRLRGIVRPLTSLLAVLGRRQERRNWLALKEFLEGS